jgi:hypothetical protein
VINGPRYDPEYGQRYEQDYGSRFAQGRGRATRRAARQRYALGRGLCRTQDQLPAPLEPAAGVMTHVTPYATSGALASSRDAIRADSDQRAYGPCYRRDGTVGTQELIFRCYRRRASTLSLTTTGQPEQQEDRPRRCRSWGPRDSHQSALGQMEQLADVGQHDLRYAD